MKPSLMVDEPVAVADCSPSAGHAGAVPAAKVG